MGATAQRQQNAKKEAKRKKERAKLSQDEINGAQWLRLRYDLIRHPSFRKLSGNALKVFFELMASYKGDNNGAISLTYAEIDEKLSLKSATASRVFKELESLGFIRKTRQGFLTLNSLYAITCFKIDVADQTEIHNQDSRKAPDDWKNPP